MNKSEYYNMIHTLYKQLHKVEAMSEEEACQYMASETKREGLKMIKDIIGMYRRNGFTDK